CNALDSPGRRPFGHHHAGWEPTRRARAADTAGAHGGRDRDRQASRPGPVDPELFCGDPSRAPRARSSWCSPGTADAGSLRFEENLFDLKPARPARSPPVEDITATKAEQRRADRREHRDTLLLDTALGRENERVDSAGTAIHVANADGGV